MNWLNLPTSIARSPEYIGAEPSQRSTWFSLIVWSADQENGGIIPGCRHWKDRRWQQTAGVTADEVADTCDLYHFDGDDLVIAFYPADKEIEVKTKRETGAVGGSKKTQAKTQAARRNGAKGGRPPKDSAPKTQAKPKRNPSENPTEEKRREEKVREEREKKDPPALSLVNFPIPPASVSCDEFCDLIDAVNSCRPEWQQAPEFSKYERAAFVENVPILRSIKPEGWEAIRSYLPARLPQGSGGFQPHSKEKFLQSPGDVLTRALDWQRKQRPHLPPKPKPLPEPEGDDATPEDIAALFPRKAAH